jgi:hypothetical protein
MKSNLPPKKFSEETPPANDTENDSFESPEVVNRPFVVDRIGIVARARKSGATIEGRPRQQCLNGERACAFLERHYGSDKWSKIREQSRAALVMMFRRSKRGNLYCIVGVLDDWDVTLYPDTQVDTREAEAIVLSRLNILRDDVTVITPATNRAEEAK